MNVVYKDKKLEEDLLHINLYNHAIFHHTLQITLKKVKEYSTL